MLTSIDMIASKCRGGCFDIRERWLRVRKEAKKLGLMFNMQEHPRADNAL